MNKFARTPLIRATRNQRGVGLVELMVGLALSLVLILGVTMLFLEQSKSYSAQDEVSQMVEGAATIAQLFAHGAHHAGYLGPSASSTANSFGESQVIDGTNGTGINSSDSVTFRYFGGVDSSGSADTSVVDCQGQPPTAASSVMVNRFFVAADPSNNNEPTLFCDNGSTVIALVSGVESMQVLFGEDLTGSGAISSFRPAHAANMDRVKQLLISAVVRSPSNSHLLIPPKSYNHFGLAYAASNVAPSGDSGGVFTSPEDRRLRRHVTFSLGVRNRLN